MASKRSSGLDFSDSTLNDSSSILDQHPDMSNYSPEGAQPVHLQRNKTERRRLQGLQRSVTNSSSYKAPTRPNTFRQKIDLWMINEGGRQLFFGVWIFLHFLVAVFGFLNYQLKDNLNNARQTFGITYRVFYFFLFVCLVAFIFADTILYL